MQRLIWTSDKPKQAGWYWWRGLGEDTDPPSSSSMKWGIFNGPMERPRKWA